VQDVVSDKKNDIKNGISYIHLSVLLLILVTAENQRARKRVPLVMQLAAKRLTLPTNAIEVFPSLEMVGQTSNGPFSNILMTIFAVSAKKAQRILMR
jgi:hypothetical protein